MNALAVVLLVVGVVAFVAVVNLAVWIPILRRNRRMQAALLAEVRAGRERIRCGPERVSYEGSTARGGRVKGLAVAVLTDRRLLIRKTVGKPIEIPAADIAGAHTAKWFRSQRIAGRTFLVVETAAGSEYGLLVHDPAPWVSAIVGSDPLTRDHR